MATSARPDFGPDWVWKPALYTMYGLGAVYIVYGYNKAPETRLKVWAKDEAIERRNRAAGGTGVDFGVNYSQKAHGLNWVREIGAKPERDSGDDDDDDEDEEE